MTKFLRKEKMNYLKGAKVYLDNTISYDNNIPNNNNLSNKNNNINTTLTNISNQLKNIAIVDKNKEFKLLNSSFRVTNKNTRNNIISSNNNNNFNSSLNIENNQNQNKSNFLDITGNSEINKKFQGLQKSKVFNFYILNQLTSDNDKEDINYEEIKKENSDLKENVKFLLKQIKRYQKSGLTIEDMDVTRQQEFENLEKQINELKQDITKYKNKIILLDSNNKKLMKENADLKNYINISINNIKFNSQKEMQNKMSNIYKNKEFNNIQNQNKNIEQFYDIGAFDEKNLEYNNLNNIYNNINHNSKLSEELLEDIANEENDNKNFLYIKEYSNHANRFRRPRINFSEGKLYCRKNIGKRFLNFNDDPYNTKKSNNNNFTYSKSYLKNNISFKK